MRISSAKDLSGPNPIMATVAGVGGYFPFPPLPNPVAYPQRVIAGSGLATEFICYTFIYQNVYDYDQIAHLHEGGV